MSIDAFLVKSAFIEKSELERAKLLAFYLFQVEKQSVVTLKEICDLFYVHGFSQPNITRLKQNMLKSKSFVTTAEPGAFTLQGDELKELQQEHPEVHKLAYEVQAEEPVLPSVLYIPTTEYVEQLAKQINSSYQYQLYDGCALLMGRLIEVLLIEAYGHLGSKYELVAKGKQTNLNAIVHHTISKKGIRFSSEATTVLTTLQKLTDPSCLPSGVSITRADLSHIKLHYKVLVEELLRAAAIKK